MFFGLEINTICDKRQMKLSQKQFDRTISYVEKIKTKQNEIIQQIKKENEENQKELINILNKDVSFPSLNNLIKQFAKLKIKASKINKTKSSNTSKQKKTIIRQK